MFEVFCQFIIPVLSCSAVFLVTRKDRSRFWGYWCGLASQPFWMYTFWHHQQWGLFALAVFYTTQWTKGIVVYYKSRGKS